MVLGRTCRWPGMPMSQKVTSQKLNNLFSESSESQKGVGINLEAVD